VTLKELIEQHENTLIRIKMRLFFLLSFEEELIKITREKPFTIRNDIVYRSIFDIWDMLIIDLASLSKGMLGRGGFFNQFKANLNQFKPKKKTDIEAPLGTIHSVDPLPQDRLDEIKVELDAHFVEMAYRTHQKQLFDLFPNLGKRKEKKVKPEDVDELKDRFEQIVLEVIHDRDENRAHRYEDLKNKTAQTRLTFKKLEIKFRDIENILNAIKIIATGINLANNDLNYVSKEVTSEELIFAILWGGNKNLDHLAGINKQMNSAPKSEKVYGWMLREKFIEHCHQKHDELQKLIAANPTAKGVDEMKKKCFNDMPTGEEKK